MITVGMNYKILPGKEKIFENAFQGVLKVMEGFPGHGRSHLYRNVNDPQEYVIFSEWQGREPFDAFIASEQFRKVADWGKEQILASRPMHTVYDK